MRSAKVLAPKVPLNELWFVTPDTPAAHWFAAVPSFSSRLADYDYDLPATRIAQSPAEPRSSARLLVDLGRPGDPATGATVADLPGFLDAGDVVVVNETRVLPARLELRKTTGGAAEVFLLQPAAATPGTWEALVRPGRRLPAGTVLVAADGTPVVEILPPVPGADDGRRFVRLLDDDAPQRHGVVPLPPYIHRPLDDADRYQTVYARVPGSVAAPTAGLHFTDEVIADLRGRGVAVHAVELAVGVDTFRPITVDDITDHHMHTERYRVPAGVLAACEAANGRVVAVGTTTVRALESAAATGCLEGRTDLFIRPGFTFRVVDVMLTNFHMPKSSLLVMLAAFAGVDRWRNLYDVALREDFRFLSFGDAMLVSRTAL
jgi:S-adenosylmethionine:tRNA ribosyltransferase-isomerase